MHMSNNYITKLSILQMFTFNIKNQLKNLHLF